ncbi:hypothetical protein Tco_0983511, partial [Tanacetum coccineum]
MVGKCYFVFLAMCFEENTDSFLQITRVGTGVLLGFSVHAIVAAYAFISQSANGTLSSKLKDFHYLLDEESEFRLMLCSSYASDCSKFVGNPRPLSRVLQCCLFCIHKFERKVHLDGEDFSICSSLSSDLSYESFLLSQSLEVGQKRARSSDTPINYAAQPTQFHEDSPSISSIIVKDREAPLIETTSDEQTSPLSLTEADEFIQEDSADFNGSLEVISYNPPSDEEIKSSTAALEPSNVQNLHQ